jgi:hypothetical protein
MVNSVASLYCRNLFAFGAGNLSLPSCPSILSLLHEDDFLVALERTPNIAHLDGLDVCHQSRHKETRKKE